MIDYLIGKVFRKNPGSSTILVGGVGYEVFIPFCYYKQYEKDNDIELDIVHIQKEDGRETLYGFFDPQSKIFFKSLLTVDGIGDKKAFSMLIERTPSELMEMINLKDLNAFKKVKGVGPKTAQKIIETLEGKIDFKDELPIITELKETLAALSFTKKEIDDFIDSLNGDTNKTIEELVSLALMKK